MKMKITYPVSDKKRYIYEFNVYENSFTHVGTYISCRNGKGDTWGDMWTRKFAKKREAEELAREEELENKGVSTYEWEYDPVLSEIRDKYNPCCQKTKDGETYYSGIYSSNLDDDDTPEEYKLKLSRAEVKKKILAKLTKNLK